MKTLSFITVTISEAAILFFFFLPVVNGIVNKLKQSVSRYTYAIAIVMKFDDFLLLFFASFVSSCFFVFVFVFCHVLFCFVHFCILLNTVLFRFVVVSSGFRKF